jgi:hypothetical protein
LIIKILINYKQLFKNVKRLPSVAAVAASRENSGGSAFGVHVGSFALEGGALEKPIKPSRKIVRDSHETKKRRIHLGNVSHPC